ncbi:MAG: hypothetical protein SNJ72_04690 [Fimbriimonadales bacterium]
MKRLTLVIASFWMIVGLSQIMTWLAGITPRLSLVAIFQVVGSVLLLLRKPFGWAMLMAMSVIMMVLGLISGLYGAFASPEQLKEIPSVMGLSPRAIVMFFSGLVSLIGTLSWLGLRRDRPANWNS